MGKMGLERTFAVVVGLVLIALGVGGLLGTPLVGGAEDTSLLVTGFGHDLVHLVTGALFLHVGLVLQGRQRAYGLVALGLFYLATGVLTFVSADLVGLYDAATSVLDQLAHLLLGLAATVIGWTARDAGRRRHRQSVARPLRG